MLLLGVIYYFAQIAYWKIKLNEVNQEIQRLNNQIRNQQERQNKYLKKIRGEKGLRSFFDALLETPKEILQDTQDTIEINVKIVELGYKKSKITKKLKSLGF